MVSKARDDLPDPLTPVMTMSLPVGRERVTFLRLCVRAPRTTMAERSEDAGGIEWSRARVFGDALNIRCYSAAGWRSSGAPAGGGCPPRLAALAGHVR